MVPMYFLLILFIICGISYGSQENEITHKAPTCQPYKLFSTKFQSNGDIEPEPQGGFIWSVAKNLITLRIRLTCPSQQLSNFEWEIEDGQWFSIHDNDPETPYEVDLVSSSSPFPPALSWMTIHQPFTHDEVKVVFRLTDHASTLLFNPCECKLFTHNRTSFDSLPLAGDLPSLFTIPDSPVVSTFLSPRSFYTIVSDAVHTNLPTASPSAVSSMGAGLYSRLTAAVRDTLEHPAPTETVFLQTDADARLDAYTSTNAAAGYIMAALVDGIMPNAVLRAARKAHDVMENFVIPDVVDILAGAVDRQGLDAAHPCFKQGGAAPPADTGAASSFLDIGDGSLESRGGADMPTDDELTCPPESFQVSRAELLRPGLVSHKVALNLAAVSPMVVQEMAEQAFAALAVDLHPVLTQRLRDPLARATAQHVERELGDLLAVSVDTGVRGVVARVLPPLLLGRLTQTLTHTGTRALGHSLSATLAHTLATSPQHEGACYACTQQQRRCEACFADDELRTRRHTKSYYRQLYASFYSDYYAELAANPRWD